MALHIASLKDSDIPKVDKAGFYAALQFGDFIFCSGRYEISKAIEDETSSCLSHVLMSWLPSFANVWLTAEATLDKGVHVGLISDYVDKYKGDICIARCVDLSNEDKYAMLNAFYSVLEEGYNTVEEATTLGHKLCSVIPIVQPKKELYCSQLVKYLRSVTSLPCGAGLDRVNYTPEDAWLDVKIDAVAAYIK